MILSAKNLHLWRFSQYFPIFSHEFQLKSSISFGDFPAITAMPGTLAPWHPRSGDARGAPQMLGEGWSTRGPGEVFLRRRDFGLVKKEKHESQWEGLSHIYYYYDYYY